ncbi:hypothetical protein [Ralstonia phage RSP15]|uniref:hypothetical protein n=1 Tax=Ralstonia phage RSP15 TaxID=1785960 RepID=UPI00074D3931|nr:hypothetical protein BH754_gp236 [Ralstonia phage RSP15]BAU40070.1 hypothetical protein [Ralstonia phage RSP15]
MKLIDYHVSSMENMDVRSGLTDEIGKVISVVYDNWSGEYVVTIEWENRGIAKMNLSRCGHLEVVEHVRKPK